eukprot:UN01164
MVSKTFKLPLLLMHLLSITKTTIGAGNNDAGRKQFEEVFLENSIQSVTWTAQHGCGNAKNNCNMVFEYTCDTPSKR